MITIDYMSLGIGAGVAFAVWLCTWLLSRTFKKKHDLHGMKRLVEGCHEHMLGANKNLQELYKIFKEVENA